LAFNNKRLQNQTSWSSDSVQV